MRVLVIGGNGFIGSAVVRTLIGEGHVVRCLLRTTSRTARIDDLPVERALGDVRDLASLRDGMAGCQGVVHLASPSSWNDIESPLMDAVVVQGTENVLAAAAEIPGIRVVYVSTSIAINGTDTPVVQDESSPCTLPTSRLRYLRAKRAAEELCARKCAAGLAITIVNPCEVYGPHDDDRITSGNLIDFAKSAPVLACRGGTSVVHVDDVATAIVAALARGRVGERYILGGDNLTISELAKLTVDLLGQRKRIITLPNWLVRALAWAGRTLKVPLPFNPAVIPYATRYWFMSSEKAQRELGVTFRSARDTLGPTLAWLRESGAV